VANDTVVDFLPLIVDLIEQPSKFLHRLLRLVQQPLSLNPTRLSLRSVGSVVALLPLLEPFNLLPPALGRDSVSSNREFDRSTTSA
jgi:hypothetical protein